MITLIGCVPAVGDSLKIGFKLMTKGHNFGRVLEAVSPALRGNIEKDMRKIASQEEPGCEKQLDPG